MNKIKKSLGRKQKFLAKNLVAEEKGSIFAPLLRHRGVAQLASALAWGASGRPFESVHPDNSLRAT